MAKHQSSIKSHESALRIANDSIAQFAVSMGEANYRLRYHPMPPVGWMNDPNGFIYFKGRYHLFYQHHPYSAEWGPMHWGHLVSDDLAHWEHLPIALAPSEPYDIGGVYSGTAVTSGDRLALAYTGITAEGDQVQCVAFSEDGVRFEKYLGNPVIVGPPPDGSKDFRDPKVWREGDEWLMLVGSHKDRNGNVLLYRSADLLAWTYAGVFSQGDGSMGTMWECPDFFACGEGHVLMLSPINMHSKNNRTIFVSGKYDRERQKFEWIPSGWRDVDGGHDFYAAQTTTDGSGRRIMIGWMDMWGSPMPSQREGWAGALTLPRLVIEGEEGRILTPPVPELRALRRESLVPAWTGTGTACKNAIRLGSGELLPLSGMYGAALELRVEFELEGCGAEEVGVSVRRSADGREETRVVYRVRECKLLVDRSRSGEVLSEDLETRCLSRDGRLRLHIFIDISSIEVFAGDCEVVLTNRIFPKPDSIGTALFADGGEVLVTALECWRL